MPWQNLSVVVTSDAVERLEVLLRSNGAVSVTMVDAGENPIFEPDLGTTPLWAQVKLSALFPIDTNLNDLEYTLRSNCERFSVETLADQDWERVWLKDFKPQCFGDRLWIYPSGFSVPDGPSVCLDPGLAFGTGDHPTTKLCLEWLSTQELRDHDVLDYGCGSGILSLAAHKLGASSVTATDIDPQAIQACQLNALRNDVSGAFNVCPPESIGGQYDIVVANILFQPLVELKAKLVGLLAPKGRLILSGILRSQMEVIVDRYGTDITFSPAKELDDWVLLTGSTGSTPAN
ncbi:MAG: 50S ribosomal protein L11 methyltransferase [Pseudomonadota bacterium]